MPISGVRGYAGMEREPIESTKAGPILPFCPREAISTFIPKNEKNKMTRLQTLRRGLANRLQTLRRPFAANGAIHGQKVPVCPSD
jgi:hypothetical protein